MCVNRAQLAKQVVPIPRKRNRMGVLNTGGNERGKPNKSMPQFDYLE